MKIKPLIERDRPLIFAHRGLSSIAPENSMAAFRLAKEMHIPGVELDIHLSTDGKLFVMHDYSSKRVSPGTDFMVETMTYDEVKKIDIGSWKGSQYKNERIPLLSDLFEELGDDLYFDIEIKSETTKDMGVEAAFAKCLKSFGYGAERITVSSFNPIALKRFKSFCPDIPTAIIYCKSDDLPWYLRGGEGRWIGGVDYLKPEHVMVKKNGVSLSKNLDKRVVVPWTVDKAEVAERVLRDGCDGVISNCPHLLGLPL